ncbi:MAG: nuclear transport factor 2 family protein [Flavobacteriaceae bacterium]
MLQKSLFVLLSIVGTALCFSQSDTEIHLFDLNITGDTLVLSNGRNISNTPGYDNQPSFYDDTTLLFASTRNGQTDIRRYDLRTGTTQWLTDTPVGSEYSPTRIPNSTDISAIRLDTTGLQRLYRYDTSKGTSTPILTDAKVGYHLWYDDALLLTTVLVDNRMDLVSFNIKKGTSQLRHNNVGRSLARIPNTAHVSFMTAQDGKHTLKSLHPMEGSPDSLAAVGRVQDICWLPNGKFLVGFGKRLLLHDTEVEGNWRPIKIFEDREINAITRLAINPSGTQLALVAEPSPEHIVQKQVTTFNARDLKGFASCFAQDVLVQRFPKDTMYVGQKALEQNYQRFFERNRESHVEVITRIVIGNKVIDEEIGHVNGKKFHQVAIYEVSNGRIASMTFLHPQNKDVRPEGIVQQQLDAYNNRDIDGFMATYTQDVALYNYPHTLTDTGNDVIKKSYGDFFANTPDLHCEIRNRIVLGHRVIDEEYITMNGSHFSAVAIYEVENGLISTVTFVR